MASPWVTARGRLQAGRGTTANPSEVEIGELAQRFFTTNVGGNLCVSVSSEVGSEFAGPLHHIPIIVPYDPNRNDN
jgi:hypothetical protein